MDNQFIKEKLKEILNYQVIAELESKQTPINYNNNNINFYYKDNKIHIYLDKELKFHSLHCEEQIHHDEKIVSIFSSIDNANLHLSII